MFLHHNIYSDVVYSVPNTMCVADSVDALCIIYCTCMYVAEHELTVMCVVCVTTIQEGFDGQMTENNIEIGVCNEAGFTTLSPSVVKDYLAAIL